MVVAARKRAAHPHPENASRRGLAQRLAVFGARFVRARGRDIAGYGAMLCRYWPVTLAMAALWGVGAYYLAFNWSDSLPWRMVWIEHGRLPGKGEYFIYEFRGTKRGLLTRTFFKRVAGTEGDIVRVEKIDGPGRGHRVWVGDTLIGEAVPADRFGIALTPAASGPVPPGHYFAQADDPASFDSRYAESGLVPFDAVRGVAHPLF